MLNFFCRSRERRRSIGRRGGSPDPQVHSSVSYTLLFSVTVSTQWSIFLALSLSRFSSKFVEALQVRDSVIFSHFGLFLGNAGWLSWPQSSAMQRAWISTCPQPCCKDFDASGKKTPAPFNFIMTSIEKYCNRHIFRHREFDESPPFTSPLARKESIFGIVRVCLCARANTITERCNGLL